MKGKVYRISISGTLVRVSKNVYLSYYRSKRRDRYYEQDIKTETAILDFHHGEVGLWLAEHWNLPESLGEPMRLHHNPERAVVYPECTAIVHIADAIIRGWGFGFPGDSLVPPIAPAAWEMLGLKMKDLPAILEVLEPKLASLSELTQAA